MDRLAELYVYLEKYEKEKLFAEAKIAVVEDMIADEKAKVVVPEEEFTVPEEEIVSV